MGNLVKNDPLSLWERVRVRGFSFPELPSRQPSSGGIELGLALDNE
jgi:hypothetical protein